MDHRLRAYCLLLLSFGSLRGSLAQQGTTHAATERTLPNGTVFATYSDAAIYLRGAIDAASDPSGNITIDMGSASAGRCKFNVNDVALALEMRDEEPGCADICPPRTIITAVCAQGPCSSDIMVGREKHSSCSFTVFDQALGLHVYETLRIMQRLVRKD